MVSGGFKEVQWDQQNSHLEVITISSGLLILREKIDSAPKDISFSLTIVKLLIVFVLLIHGVEDCLVLVAREESVKCENYLDFPRERLKSGAEAERG